MPNGIRECEMNESDDTRPDRDTDGTARDRSGPRYNRPHPAKPDPDAATPPAPGPREEPLPDPLTLPQQI